MSSSPNVPQHESFTLVFHRALLDLRRMKLGYDEGGAGTEVGSSMVLRARVLV
jgi:hypothetical protein